jgi:hypothetical protein
LWLVRNGVPFDVAFGLDSTTRSAWSIIFSEQESGKRYNFATQQYEGGE